MFLGNNFVSKVLTELNTDLCMVIILYNILKRSRECLLYTKKETSSVLKYDNIWLLLLPPV